MPVGAISDSILMFVSILRLLTPVKWAAKSVILTRVPLAAHLTLSLIHI